MQKLTPKLEAVLVTVILLVCWGQSFAAILAPNWAQVDLTETWPCPTPTGTTGTFFDVPGLALSLTTTGGPVLLTVNFTFHAAVGASAYWLEPVIDGEQKSADRLSWQTGNDTEIDNSVFQRVYALPAGSHTFAVRMSCQNQISVLRGWLTVYALPAVKK
jgi:hypothetical protein